MTYSIVALDRKTGELGVGVQTHQPAVGAVVPWVKAGVGAVATQSFANAAFGPQALALLEAGLDAPRTLAAILTADVRPALRQVAILDASGRAAVHTGDACVPHADHRIGDNYSVQANMMRNDTVPAAMARAFEGARGPLPVRLLTALDAAEAEGGDVRGGQSAAILVRGPGTSAESVWDLRVDNDPQPLARLRELVNIRLATQLLTAAGAEAARSSEPARALERALAGYEEAQRLAPSDEQTFWFAVWTLSEELGAIERAVALLDPLFARAPQWRELLHRLSVLRNPALLEHFPRGG